MIIETPFITNDGGGCGRSIGFNIPVRPTISDIPKKNWWGRWRCRHLYVELYKEDIMFCQERMGRAYHFACIGCGLTRIEERDS